MCVVVSVVAVVSVILAPVLLIHCDSSVGVGSPRHSTTSSYSILGDLCVHLFSFSHLIVIDVLVI